MKLTDRLKRFILFIENPVDLNETEKLDHLESELVNLLLIGTSIKGRQSKNLKTYCNYEELRVTISNNFPQFGFYNDTLEIGDNIGETEFIVGDAIDDLTDITMTIKEALSFSKEKDTIGHLKLNFEFHLKSHIINLLRYINSKTNE
jgi:hypothetical protein